MGRLRRSSPTIEQAEARANGLKSKDKDFDLGNGLTAAVFDQQIAATRAKLETYNQTLATADDQQNELLAAEQALKDLSGRVLAAVKAKYGPDSSEYELAGGTRTSERKRPTRKQPTPKP
jgi:hypothetical protein